MAKVNFYYDVISPYGFIAWKVMLRYYYLQKPNCLWHQIDDLQAVPVFLGGIMKSTGNSPPAKLPARAMFQEDDLRRNAEFFNIDILDPPANFFTEVARDVIRVQRILFAARSILVMGINSSELHVDEELQDLIQDHGESIYHALITRFFTAIHCDESLRTAAGEVKIDREWIKKRVEEGLLNAVASHFYKPSLSTRHARNRTSDVQELLSEVETQLVELITVAGMTQETKNELKDQTLEVVAQGAFGVPWFRITKGSGDSENVTYWFGSDRFEQMCYLNGWVWEGPDPQRESKL